MSRLTRKGINAKSKNGMWKGDSCSVQNGRMRAEHWYPIDKCEVCGARAIDRHHRDKNPLNNNPENIQPLCRRCHMQIDGRMSKFEALERFRVHGVDGKYISREQKSSYGAKFEPTEPPAYVFCDYRNQRVSRQICAKVCKGSKKCFQKMSERN